MQTYGNTITVTKNSKYWQKRDGVALPYLDKMVFKPLTDSKTRLAAVQSGGVDIMQTADTDNLVEAKKDPNLVIQPVTGSSSTILILNIKKPPFNDIRAREALNYGLNRIDLNQRAYQGARVPAYGFFPPTDPYYDPTAQLPSYDLTKAKALVTQLKNEGKPTDYQSLCIPTPEASQDFSILKQQAAQAGTTVTLNTLDQASFVAALLGGKANYQVACFRSPQAADPDEFYSSLHTGGSTNIPGYSNKVVDQALDSARKYTDINTRRRLYNTVQKQVSKDVVFVPLLFDLYGNVHSNKTSGLSKPWPNSLGLINTGTLYFIK
jgi:ABC-type transport system substrate-binding protein